jgi:hypothetical protein
MWFVGSPLRPRTFWRNWRRSRRRMTDSIGPQASGASAGVATYMPTASPNAGYEPCQLAALDRPRSGDDDGAAHVENASVAPTLRGMTKVTAQMSISLDGCYAGPMDPRDLRRPVRPRVAALCRPSPRRRRSRNPLPVPAGSTRPGLHPALHHPHRARPPPTRYARCNPATACSCTAPSHPRTSAPTPTTATAASPTAPPSHPPPPLPRQGTHTR